MLREYAEELLGRPEDYGTAEHPFDYDAWPFGREPTQAAGDQVSKWERGEKGLSPLTRELFAKLYGVTIEQLGLSQHSGSPADPSPTDRTLVAFLDTPTGLLNHLGAAGAVLQAQMFALLDPLTAARTDDKGKWQGDLTPCHF